ncbi:hypothetical protein KC614_00795 [candidate division WWE3 bacterium]|uniref:Cohesin domain-containing protein n=1 Tax=candidate division WWE3 bacterium TaxID=2053526 RepID=A0A955LJ80_UNCKA|nr:hypothetical protein [candidate division WWE3 bacterium]
MPKFAKKIFTTSLIFFGLLLISSSVDAAGPASLTPYPSASTVYKGSTFTVTVLVNTGGKSTNAFQATVRYPTDKVQAVAVSKGGSVCQLWVRDPSYSNGSGTASFECGTPANYNGGSGTIGSITFRAINTGVATISVVSPSQVLAADGSGTNVLGSTGSRSVTINEPPQSGPGISSSTHPNQDAWYKSNDVSFSWSASNGPLGYSINFDQNGGTSPDEVQDTTDTSKTYSSVNDGIWYFHARTRYSNVWSSSSSYRVQIDTTPPEDFIPTIDPEGISETPTPTVYFNTSDATSGVVKYLVSIDDGAFTEQQSPYQLPAQRSGSHIVTIKAVDAAGNETTGKVEVKIKEIPVPEFNILNPNIIFGEEIKIQGKGVSNGIVSIFLDTTENKIGETTANEDGAFDFTIPAFGVVPFEHEIFISMLDETSGLESAATEPQSISIQLSSIRLGSFIFPWWVIVIILGILLGLFLVFIIFLIIKSRRKRNILHEQLEDVKEEIDDDFGELESEVKDSIKDSTTAQKIKQELEEESTKLKHEMDIIDPIVKTKDELVDVVGANDKPDTQPQKVHDPQDSKDNERPEDKTKPENPEDSSSKEQESAK